MLATQSQTKQLDWNWSNRLPLVRRKFRFVASEGHFNLEQSIDIACARSGSKIDVKPRGESLDHCFHMR